MKEIVIDVSADGEITIETRGYVGESCLEDSQFLKDLLGCEIMRNLTPTYFMGKKKTKKYLQICG